MTSNDHRQDRACETMECSPKSLAKRIESCIVRNALDEEQRAQKALYLLKTRDRRIALLEKRVAELQNVAQNIHELGLRNSSVTFNAEQDKETVSDVTRSERSLKTDDEAENAENTLRISNENSDTVSEGRISIPRLKLSKSSTSNSERDIFSTAIDFFTEKDRSSVPVVDISKKNQNPGETDAQKGRFDEKNLESKSEMKFGGSNNQERCVFTKNTNEKFGKLRYGFPRTSSSVPWIRAKNSFRRKLRNFELRTGRRVEQLPVGDGYACSPFRRIETDQRQTRKQEIVDDAKTTGKCTVAREQDVQGTHLIADDKIDKNVKTVATQTSVNFAQENRRNLQITEAIGNSMYRSSSCICFEQKGSSKFCGINEDPAPQWLIEEALNRGLQRSERWTKGKISSNKEIEYQNIIAELESKLVRTKEDLEEALQSKSLAKERYKRSLEDIKMEARKENEVLQDKVVQICTSILENFGPNSMIDKKRNTYQIKYRSRLRCHQKISSKLHKKLRMAVARSGKLKRELAAARKALKNKSEMYESISKCFDELKRDMDTTEMNLNNLISENLSLRKKIEDTRDWLEEHNGSKENPASNHFRDAHKNRELTNLKKKVEEDKTTIVQLRNRYNRLKLVDAQLPVRHQLRALTPRKLRIRFSIAYISGRKRQIEKLLMRSESANANKGFLLNSYKSQLTELNKEKAQLVSRINSLENEISAVRNNNSQLKAKISILNNEKDKLHSDNEKSKTDITEKIETRCAKKCERTIQQETEIVKNKYEEIVKSMKTKMVAISNQNSEYSKAIKEFLRKLCSQGNYESQKNSKENEGEASEREAHETACNILNMTPEELSGFLNGKTSNSMNSWMVELNRILAENHFSENLSKFLFRKAMKKLKTSNV